MSVHQLKDGRWIVQYRDPDSKNKFKREYFGRGPGYEKEARERDDALSLRGYEKRTPGPDRSPLFADLAKGYLAARMATIENTTYKILEYKLEAFLLPELGNTETLKISKERIDKYVEKRMAAGRKNSTIHREITDIQAIINWAVERKIIHYNPLAGYKKPRPETDIVIPPTLSEMIEIDRHAPDHLRRALKIIYYTGARPGKEITSLKWSNVNWDQNTIRIVSAKKHGLKYRDVPICEDFRKLLEEWMKEDRAKGDGINDISIINYKNKPIISLQTSWGRAKRMAGITRAIRPYSYRHAFVSSLLDSGADLKSVSEIVGHSNPNLTLRVYQHTNKLMHQNAIQRLPKMRW
jgi:site-specific recombinase XerD